MVFFFFLLLFFQTVPAIGGQLVLVMPLPCFFCGAFCIGSVSREKMKTYKTDWRSYYRANEEKSSARGNEEVILSVWDCTPVVKGSRRKQLWCGKIKYLSDRARS